MPFLVTPPLPNLTVEIAFDSGFATPEGDRTWTDISTYVEGASSVDITYGRADELSTPDPNTCSLTLDNRDGRFTPAKSSSPYFPNVKKGKPLRVTVTYAGVDYIRFTGYVNEWPLVWPDSTSAAATVTISASSRRARLGQTAPLTSAIRAAYLASSPEAYWPLSDNETNSIGQWVFRDIMNSLLAAKATQLLAGFSTGPPYWPIRDDGLIYPHITDEGGTVLLPSTPTSVSTFATRYVGGAGATKINTGVGGFSGEIVARIVPQPAALDPVDLVVFRLGSPALRQEIYCFVYDDTVTGGHKNVGITMILRDDNFAIIEQPTWFFAVADQAAEDALYDLVTDGDFHHWYMVYVGQIGALYIDGEYSAFTVFSGSNAFTKQVDAVVIGNITRNANLFVSSLATYDRLFTPDELTDHANAATAASETDAERVERVAGRIGVPADEVDTEASIASPVGPQAEAGRSAAEVLDELATSVGGVLYDTREGHLAMQARNHRYNQASAFTLSATLQEIQGDLTITDDHRYTLNSVEFTRSGSDAVPSTLTDQDSIDAYGIFAQTFTVISESDTEVEAFAQDRLARFADPDPRVSTVAVDVVNLDAPQRALTLAADIGTRFGIAALASQAPTDPMHLFLEGYSESITATSHTLTMNTTPAELYQNIFTLDDPTLGVLDADNVIAY